MKTYFFPKKNTLSSSYFLISPTFKFLLKNHMIKVEMTFLRNNTIWYAFYSKFATFKDLEIIQFLFSKNHLFFQKRPKFWKFWELLLLQSNSMANLLSSAIFKKIPVFRKNHLVFQKRPKFRTFWGILLFQAHSTANLLQFGQKIFSRSVAWTYLPMWRERNWQTSGKKRRKWPIWVEGFAFIFLRLWRKIKIQSTLLTI